MTIIERRRFLVGASALAASGALGKLALAQTMPAKIKIDEKSVLNSLDLFRVLDGHQVGDKVVLKVDRNGEKRDVDVTLQAIQ